MNYTTTCMPVSYLMKAKLRLQCSIVHFMKNSLVLLRMPYIAVSYSEPVTVAILTYRIAGKFGELLAKWRKTAKN